MYFVGSQVDAKSLHNIDGAFLMLTKTESTRDEIVGEACSPSIPKTVDGPSTRFHEKTDPLVHELQTGGQLPGLASG